MILKKKKIIQLKIVLREMCKDIDPVTDIDLNEGLKAIVR